MPKESAHRRLIVFAREPVKGRVKTRLAVNMSEEHVLKLYKAFLKDTVDLAKKVSCEERVLSYAPVDAYPYLKRIGEGFRFYCQKGETLGERMLEAFCEKADCSGACQTVIIGTDSPHLPVRLVNRAFGALKKMDIVLGPSEDGGFYLIGMRDSYPEIFQGVVWSSGSVLDKVLENINNQRLRVELLDNFFDIDTPKDLEKLKVFLRNKKGCAWETRKMLNCL
jgi:rSAM/selenodomain-associated transferase 1